MTLNNSNAGTCFACEETKQPALCDQVLLGYVNKTLAAINTHTLLPFKNKHNYSDKESETQFLRWYRVNDRMGECVLAGNSLTHPAWKPAWLLFLEGRDVWDHGSQVRGKIRVT